MYLVLQFLEAELLAHCKVPARPEKQGIASFPTAIPAANQETDPGGQLPVLLLRTQVEKSPTFSPRSACLRHSLPLSHLSSTLAKYYLPQTMLPDTGVGDQIADSYIWAKQHLGHHLFHACFSASTEQVLRVIYEHLCSACPLRSDLQHCGGAGAFPTQEAPEGGWPS